LPLDIKKSPLVSFLSQHGGAYHAKLFELRHEVAGWLAYSTASFTHYTAHTVSHSDEVIRQLSHMLFAENDPSRPVVSLSATEAYVLCASALLHDTGMVVSDSELHDLLASDAWRSWIREEPSAQRRLAEIEGLRNGTNPPDQLVRNLIADREMRYVVLEYVRRVHHGRSAQFLTENEDALGRFAFDDPTLVRTIASVCLGHGLSTYELEDRDAFPEQRDIQGDKVNVRFCALLLRIADLLDMSYDRACPLLLNAASPLPPESIAHWTQYQRIIHRMTSPTRIEITAECDTQDEHRYLHDWCSWIVREVSVARSAMAHSTRHAGWVPPAAAISPDGPIVIRPSPTASYVAVDWQLELDTEAVLGRLIHDVSPDPNNFLRELLQNAFDASRCRMYEEMKAAGVALPKYPSAAPQEWRDRFPVHVTRATVTRFNQLSQAEEERDVIVVEDLGVGMTPEIILKYLLQVGRSYYTSEDFARRYPFVPTSRFGIGFLSVFSVADEVRVETRGLHAPAEDGVSLTLRGPRSYVLTERVERPHPGTRITVIMRKPLDLDVADLVRYWCPRVEFSIIIADRGTSTEIRAEQFTDFVYEEPSVLDENETMGVRAFPVAANGAEGEVYVFYRRTLRGESWVDHAWAKHTYPKLHPQARPPRTPASLVCFHGVRISSDFYSSETGISTRLDYRRDVKQIPLSRELLADVGVERFGLNDRVVQEHVIELARNHLAESSYARGPDAWQYKQRLARLTGLRDFWLDEPMVRVFRDGHPALETLRRVAAFESIDVITRVLWALRSDDAESQRDRPYIEGPALWSGDLLWFSSTARRYLFGNRCVAEAEWLDDTVMRIRWRTGEPGVRLRFGPGSSQLADVVPLSSPDFSVRIHRALDDTYDHGIVNANHPLGKWLLEVHGEAAKDEGKVGRRELEGLTTLLASPIWHSGLHVEQLTEFLERWRHANIGGLPPPEPPPKSAFAPRTPI
jgi:molecular chaperone HtpG